MTTALWITNVIVALLVIADMLYGRHMSIRIEALEIELRKLKKKPKTKATKKKNASKS